MSTITIYKITFILFVGILFVALMLPKVGTLLKKEFWLTSKFLNVWIQNK